MKAAPTRASESVVPGETSAVLPPRPHCSGDGPWRLTWQHDTEGLQERDFGSLDIAHDFALALQSVEGVTDISVCTLEEGQPRSNRVINEP